MNTIKEKPVERPFPSRDEIKDTLGRVEMMLSVKQLNMFKNAAIKEGLTDCKRILLDRLQNPENKWFKPEKQEDIQRSTDIYKEQIKGIEKLKTTEGRSLAVMCVDYLNGQIEKQVILDFEKLIKMR